MWKGRRLAGHMEVAPASTSEQAIESRDKTLRALVAELEAETRELRSMYKKESGDQRRKN